VSTVVYQHFTSSSRPICVLYITFPTLPSVLIVIPTFNKDILLLLSPSPVSILQAVKEDVYFLVLVIGSWCINLYTSNISILCPESWHLSPLLTNEKIQESRDLWASLQWWSPRRTYDSPNFLCQVIFSYGISCTACHSLPSSAFRVLCHSLPSRAFGILCTAWHPLLSRTFGIPCIVSHTLPSRTLSL